MSLVQPEKGPDVGFPPVVDLVAALECSCERCNKVAVGEPTAGSFPIVCFFRLHGELSGTVPIDKLREPRAKAPVDRKRTCRRSVLSVCRRGVKPIDRGMTTRSKGVAACAVYQQRRIGYSVLFGEE